MNQTRPRLKRERRLFVSNTRTLLGDRYEALMSLDAIQVNERVISADLNQQGFSGLWNEPFSYQDVLPLVPDE